MIKGFFQHCLWYVRCHVKCRLYTIATAGAGLGAVATIAAFSGCRALTGVGTAMVIHPVAKKMSGERIMGGNYVKDVAIGYTIRAVTGHIGLGGASATASIASKVGTEFGKQGAVKFVCRTAVEPFLALRPAKQTVALKIKENVMLSYDIVQNLEQNVNALRLSESTKRNKLSPQQLLNELEANEWTTIECQIKQFLPELPPEEVKKQLNLAKEVTDVKKEQPKLTHFLKLIKKRKKVLKKGIDEMSANCRRIPEQQTKVKEIRNELKRLNA